MQSNRQTVAPAKNTTQTQAKPTPVQPPIVVLDAATLKQVAGGLSPKGTW